MARASSGLSIEDLTVTYGHGAGASTVLHAVTIDIRAGSTVGLVGESGAGKSTVAKAVIGIVEPTAGTIRPDGVDLATLSGKER